jgi:hypothetical protein
VSRVRSNRRAVVTSILRSDFHQRAIRRASLSMGSVHVAECGLGRAERPVIRCHQLFRTSRWSSMHCATALQGGVRVLVLTAVMKDVRLWAGEGARFDGCDERRTTAHAAEPARAGRTADQPQVGSAQDHHRAGSVRDDVLAHRAQQHSGEPPAAAGPDHDQVGPL